MKVTRKLIPLMVLLLPLGLGAQDASIRIESGKPSGLIDSKIYGQLFEHIYFSANNGVWQELIYERSFEPEHYPGIHPRDGYFDGWFADDDYILHSPTRYEQPIRLSPVEGQEYEITMDINWRSYKLARRSWSGGLEDIRIQFMNDARGEPVYFRIHDPYYESRRFSPAQTEAMIQADRAAQAAAKVQKEETEANFSLSRKVTREVPSYGGRTRSVEVLDPVVSKIAAQGQIDESQTWHKLRLVRKGKSVKAYWDGSKVISTSLAGTGSGEITLWVNYTEALFRNIEIKSGNRIIFSGMPADVAIPDVAPQWNSFGGGSFSLVKDDAVNMRYSQKIEAADGFSGVSQGPQNIVCGEKYIGSLWAKGDGTAELSVALTNGGKAVASQTLGRPGSEWKEYSFTMSAGEYSGDADFAIRVKGGAIQVDQVTMTTGTGESLGGFRPDIFKSVKDLQPTCLRWPGGGYVAQYHWKWGIGKQKDRERWPHWMWMDYDQNCFGTDEFIKFCRAVNTEPVIVVSVGFERPESEFEDILQEAVDWVAYCNEPATGKWGSVRAANGHPDPYNVKYWEIDNEMWEMGIEKYEKCVRIFSEAMRKVSPDIKIIACGGFQEDEEFLKRSGNFFDYLSLHHYEQRNGYASGPARLQEQYNRYAGMIAECPNPNIKLFISEWNLQSIDWRTGLFAGGFLNVCENTPVVELGAAALFIRRTDMPDWNNAFINFDYKDVFVAPNYQVTKLWHDHFSKYRLSWSGDSGDLSIVTTLSENGKEVIVKVVNASDSERKLEISGDWAGLEKAVYKYYAPGTLDAANSMTDKDAVALKTKTLGSESGKVSLDVPSLSAGVIVLEKRFN